MDLIFGKIKSFSSETMTLQSMYASDVRADRGHTVQTYSELIQKIAQLAYANPDFVLLMRGQSGEYPENFKAGEIERHGTTLFPSMYRMPGAGHHFYVGELAERYRTLREKELNLYHILEPTPYSQRIGRNELARWAILQHYEICPTPLIDVTQSVLVACSFARLQSKPESAEYSFIYVLGVPQISGAVSVSPAQGLQVVRLSSMCPPETLRPYFQEGYLMGTYPSVDTLDEKMRYFRSEMDCARRLIGKFRISNSPDFWD